jgi:purine-binding chemotaxis protein CheW
MVETDEDEETFTTEGMMVTFSLDGETFAIDVDRVEEIVDPPPVTRVPNADPFAPGLVNVRGQILPVLDLRRRLGMPPATRTERSRVLVLGVDVGGEQVRVAVPADSVDEIIETTPDEIETTPDLGLRWPAEYIKGVAKKDGALVILINEETALPPAGSRPGAH